MIRRSRLTAAALLFTCTGFLPLPIFAAPTVPTATVAPENALADAVQKAISQNTAVADAAIARLRAAGPAGLEALFAAYGAQVEAADDADPMWPRIRRAIEKTAGQRDAHASKLFWYKDLEQAKAAAKASGKPILSLRMMGQLDEEFSCANSRFFRIILYGDRSVANYLRESFILHWRSVRPVPKVTIDFGDGRKLERTITGNSIHYVLDSDGNVVDALPGLYEPNRFARELKRAQALVELISKQSPEERKKSLNRYADVRAAALIGDRGRAARRAGLEEFPVDASLPTPSPSADAARALPFGDAPTALAASEAAMAKSTIEVNIIRAIQPAGTSAAAPPNPWKTMAERYGDIELHASSIQLLKRKLGSACPAEAEFARTQDNFRLALAEDTLRNDYLFRPIILDWLRSANRADVEGLNERVYATLFLTPSSDPWLGLLPKDAVIALDGNGIVQPTAPTFEKPAPTPVKATVKRRAPRR